MRTLLYFLLLLIPAALFAQSAPVYHKLDVLVQPDQQSIAVDDEILLEAGYKPERLTFLLHGNLQITNHSQHIQIRQVGTSGGGGDIGMDRDDAGMDSSALKLNEYEVVFKDKNLRNQPFKITYKGQIHSPVVQSEENYQRGFSESPGIISEIGVYLAGSTYWVPTFPDAMLRFDMSVSLPEGWKSVSQGGRTLQEIRNSRQVESWHEDKPQEEIFLIGAKFNEYAYQAGNVLAMAFLRTPDEALATKYLETTAQYLEMYRQLVGPFPYPKFALVENFWETGYGMPSFTLLGEKIIRFPFILHSSYPHELLHNWWGNSVYIDFETGNWCEGLTAYMADHLIKEQREQGDEYRRTTLQKYTDYVTPENDFPVDRFKSRYNAPSEAIGYGKVSMLFHMLRERFGDEAFVRAIQQFNRKYAFRTVGFAEIQQEFESVTGQDLKGFFDQWIHRTGAPELALQNVQFSGGAVSFTLRQIQEAPAYELDVPVLLETSLGQAFFRLPLNQKEQKYTLETEGATIRDIRIDPKYDLFRILHPNEVPASLSKAYGSKNTLFVLPADAAPSRLDMYRQFVSDWQDSNAGAYETILDSALEILPADRTSWILGYENRFSANLLKGLENQEVVTAEKEMHIGKQTLSKQGNTTVLTTKNPGNLNEALVFLAVEKTAAIPGLVRKLPHYGKYSYLAFEGDEPTNTVKGQWDVVDSPLSAKNPNATGGVDTVEFYNEETKAFVKRKALADLAPVFSGERIMDDVRFLASSAMKGRGIGTPELDEAAKYIREAFRTAGLESGPGTTDYFQSWTQSVGNKGATSLTNVIGMIPGSDPRFEHQPVVISAHYDHLGTGWPDVHAGDEGQIHFGADDNASGVAILLELARNMGKAAKPLRPVWFVAFTAEEAGLVGSRHFVAEFIQTHPGAKPFANLNLDTDGRLFDKKLLVLNGNTAREWKFIFMGTEYVTGVKTELVAQSMDASDQVAFNEKGIPAVQLFAGAHEDYHRPGDVAEKLDPAGMVKIATVAKEVIQYLGDREDAMPYTGVAAKESTMDTGEPKEKRRASTGSMPDFAFAGPGVRIASVAAGSAGEKAGLQVGDVILQFDGKPMANLREYSNALKTKQPGDKVRMEVQREAERLQLEIVLGER